MTTTALKATAIALTAVLGAVSLDAVHTQAKANDALVGGVIGFAAGTIVGAAAQPRYVQPAPVIVYEQPRVVRRGGNITPAGVPVSHARWCASKYRSYDWNSNTYVSYSGHVRQCR
ncbi:MAG: BA14K family protein [Pseudomonadota bacterium]